MRPTTPSAGSTGIDDLTEVQDFGTYWAKREDRFAQFGLDGPTGSKVRQYVKMAEAAPGATMIVGCSADSAMQVYVAAAGKHYKVPAVVYVPARAVRTSSTRYAADMGAELVEIRPGYLSVVRSRARDRAREIGRVVRWDPNAAFRDTVWQCENIPKGVRRVIVPTGSGLTAAAVLAGLCGRRRTRVVAVAVSGMPSASAIVATALRFLCPHGKLLSGSPELPPLDLIPPGSPYGVGKAAVLPDETLLDPYYAAKALPHVKIGDCLWISGRRAFAAFPPSVLAELGLPNGV